MHPLHPLELAEIIGVGIVRAGAHDEEELLGTIIATDYHSSNNKTRLTRSSFSRLLLTPLFLSPNILAPGYVQTY